MPEKNKCLYVVTAKGFRSYVIAASIAGAAEAWKKYYGQKLDPASVEFLWSGELISEDTNAE